VVRSRCNHVTFFNLLFVKSCLCLFNIFYEVKASKVTYTRFRALSCQSWLHKYTAYMKKVAFLAAFTSLSLKRPATYPSLLMDRKPENIHSDWGSNHGPAGLLNGSQMLDQLRYRGLIYEVVFFPPRYDFPFLPMTYISVSITYMNIYFSPCITQDVCKWGFCPKCYIETLESNV